MKPQSAKAKGRILQQWTRDTILRLFSSLEPDDVKSTGMGQNGEDIQLSPAARKVLPLSIECKNIAKFAGYKYLDQSKGNSKTYEPIAVVKANLKKPIVLVDAEFFFNLMKESKWK